MKNFVGKCFPNVKAEHKRTEKNSYKTQWWNTWCGKSDNRGFWLRLWEMGENQILVLQEDSSRSMWGWHAHRRANRETTFPMRVYKPGFQGQHEHDVLS